MKNPTGIWILLLCIAVAGCNAESGPNIRDLTAQEQKLVQASNQLGFKLFCEVVEQSDGKDVFVSPLSISLALGMTYNGARRTTEEGIRETLEYEDLSLEEINQAYQGLIDYLTNLDPKVSMEIANSIWYREGFQVLQTFIDVNMTFFNAVVNALDFSDPGAADTINAWVDENTHGKIDSIVDAPIDPNTVMFLINAIYFKGTWTYKFDQQKTQATDFHLSDDQTKTVKMMNTVITLPYLEDETFQAVRLPYGHELFNMTILLPNQGKDIDALISSLNTESFNTWMNNMSETELTLGVPRFELEYEKILNDVLIALGMEKAFSPGDADFSGIRAGGGIYISRVKHKSYVKVDEEGTEAAAVTSVEIRETSSEGKTMLVNRPFLFVIHDTHSKALLFMGKIVNPDSE